MTWLFHMGQSSPAAVALFGAHFVVYALVAWLVLGTRFFAARMRNRELVLLEVWLGLLVLELVQMAYHRGDFIHGETWGVPRYFGVFAPILWIWLAWLCARIWKASFSARGVPVKYVLRPLLVGALLWMGFGITCPELTRVYRAPVRRDVSSAADQARRYIRAEYAGPHRQEAFKRTTGEYFNDRRPVVFSDFGYAAWLLGTQSEGAMTGSGACPYPDDYLFFRVGTGYGGHRVVDTSAYDCIGDFRTTIGSTWRLFRRKGVPHRYVPQNPNR